MRSTLGREGGDTAAQRLCLLLRDVAVGCDAQLHSRARPAPAGKQHEEELAGYNAAAAAGKQVKALLAATLATQRRVALGQPDTPRADSPPSGWRA